MTTSKEELDAIRKRHEKSRADIQNNFGAAYSSRIEQDSYSIHEDRGKALTHIEALEAELAAMTADRDMWMEIVGDCAAAPLTKTPERDLTDVCKRLRAQLATRLPPSSHLLNDGEEPVI